MKHMILFCIVGVLASLVSSQQTEQYPYRPFGFPLAPTNQNYNMTIEIFLDLLFTNTEGFYENYETFLQDINYTSSFPFQTLVYVYAQPNESYSFWSSVGALIVYNLSSNLENVFTYIDNILSNQGQINNNLLKTNYQMQQYIGQIGLKSINITLNQFMTAISNPVYSHLAKQNLKYSISRRVSGAPCAYGNGVLIDGADQFNNEEWTNWMNNIGVTNSEVPSVAVFTKFTAPYYGGIKFKTLRDL